MKVVINRCFGGFNLSSKAVERCIEKGMVATKFNKDGNYDNKDADFVENDMGFSNYYIVDTGNAFRCDPRVVSTVEELGSEADGFCSQLKVIEIPFDSEAGWTVEQYDGMERVVPEHESWY